MPADVTIFGASYLVFIAAALAAAVLVFLLWSRPRLALEPPAGPSEKRGDGAGQ